MKLIYTIGVLGFIGLLGFLCVPACTSVTAKHETGPITPETIAAAGKLIGLEFTDTEIALMMDGLGEQLTDYKRMSEFPIDNSVPPALSLTPLPAGFQLPTGPSKVSWVRSKSILPQNIDELAFYTLPELANLLRSRQITSVELTRFFLDRLKQYGDTLQCVISLTETRALEQARKADEEIAAGNYKGPLHGIPYGAKDLLAVPGYPTTWGARPYKDQERQELATVIQKLDAAGAILIAKLTMGALAWGDVWFGGTTKNPWDLEQGSSGSSAGSASATAAGLVPFSIGTETWGSIVSPATRCGDTGLRPTYGRVSRYGAMALSWSMDKIGPICRSAEDCARVFAVIHGPDPQDQTLIDAPFSYGAAPDFPSLSFAYLEAEFEKDRPGKTQDKATLDLLTEMGATLQAVQLPESLPTSALGIILSAEAAAAFDELTRSGKDDLLVRQIPNAWPNVFRTARMIPAVEYIQANRLRYLLIQKMDALMRDIDVLVCPSFGGDQLLLTNLTGHPCVVLPNGFDESGHPKSITLVGKLFDESTILAVAAAYQAQTDFHRQHPEWLR